MSRPTTTEQLLRLHAFMTEQARQVMTRKNADYGAQNDPFANFQRHGATGILVRMDDKMARLTSFSAKGRLDATEETVMDTALDLINYAVLLMGYLGVEY